MALAPRLPYTLPEYKDLIWVKTNVGGWFFDAFLSLDHNSTATPTEHPIQTGAAITDHVIIGPQELTIQIGMSDVAKSLVNGQFTGGWSRSVTAYKIIKELWRNRIPLQIVTRLDVYQNMIVENIIATDTYENLNNLKATITFRELLIARVETVRVSERPQVSDNSKVGTVEPQEPQNSVKESILFQIFGQ